MLYQAEPCVEYDSMHGVEDLWRVIVLNKPEQKYQSHYFFREDDKDEWIESEIGATLFLVRTDCYKLSGTERPGLDD